MKQVNAALRDIGIPVYAGVWRATSPNQNPPVQYCVYSTTTTEASHHDDHVTSFYYENRDIPDMTTYKATRMAFDSLLYPYRDPEKMF